MDKFVLPVRVVHLTSSGFLAGSIILNYFFNTHSMLADQDNYMSMFHPAMGVITLVSGLVNICLLKPAKNEENGAKTDEEPD